MLLEINNLTKEKVNRKQLNGFFTKVSKILKLKNSEVSVAFVSEKEIADLNKIYRGKNKVTDVLSFGEGDIKWDKSFKFRSAKNFLGEIIICPKIIKTQSKKLKASFNFQIKKIFLHGLLHLLGYDHGKNKEAEVMEKLEESLLIAINRN